MPGGAPSVAAPASSLPLRFQNTEPVSPLSSPEKDDNPTLTADELTICFTSNRPGGTGDVDVYCANRGSRAEQFAPPVEISIINSTGFESSSAIDLDGLTLWVGSERADGQGGMDIYRSTRATRNDDWSAPEPVVELNSVEDDIPRPTAMGGTVMPLGSRRTAGLYWTYIAKRSAPSESFSSPQLIDEIASSENGVVDAQLSEDGLHLVFTSTSTDSDIGDLFAAERPSLSEPFSKPMAIEGINSEFEERDPWLSPDGQTLYFSSNRSGNFEIYRATRVP